MKTEEESSLSTFILDDLLHPLKKEPLKAGLLLAKTSAQGSDACSILISLVKTCCQKKYHIIAAPEYSFFSHYGPLKESDVQLYLEALKKASCVGETLLIPGTFVWQKDKTLFNTCFVIYQGEIIHQHNKNKWGGEAAIAERYGLQADLGTTPGLFEWEGLKLGIEICAEKGLLWKSGIRDLDLAVLSSCGLGESTLRTSMEATRENGYGLMVDGYGPFGNAAKKISSDLYGINYLIEKK